MKLPDSNKSNDELVADFHEATQDLQEAMGTDSQDAVVQRIADAIGLLSLRGSTSQLQEMGVLLDASPSLVLPASDPDAIELDEAVAKGDIEAVRALLSERNDIPAGLVDAIIASLVRNDDDHAE